MSVQEFNLQTFVIWFWMQKCMYWMFYCFWKSLIDKYLLKQLRKLFFNGSFFCSMQQAPKDRLKPAGMQVSVTWGHLVKIVVFYLLASCKNQSSIVQDVASRQIQATIKTQWSFTCARIWRANYIFWSVKEYLSETSIMIKYVLIICNWRKLSVLSHKWNWMYMHIFKWNRP